MARKISSRRAVATAVLILVSLVRATSADAAPAPGTKCRSAKQLAMATEAKCLASIYRKSMIFGIPPAAADVQKCTAKLIGSFTKAEERAAGACPTTGDGSTIEAATRACIDDAVADLGGPTGSNMVTDSCQSKKILKAGLYAQCRATTYGKAILKGVAASYTKCVDKLTKAFSDLDAKSSCATTNDLPTIKGAIDGCLDQMADALAVDASFRLSTISVVDPTFIIPAPPLPPSVYCGFDATASVTNLIQGYVDGDGNGDTYRDLSLLLVQSSSDQVGTVTGTAAAANCAHADPSVCALVPSGFQPTLTFNHPVGPCAVGSTTVSAGVFGCFATASQSFPIALGPLTLSLEGAQTGAQYDGKPANNLVNGRLRGFLPKSVADATIIDPSTPLVGGQALSVLLRGPQCGALSELQVGPDGITQGWWVDLAYTAQKATLP